MNVVYWRANNPTGNRMATSLQSGTFARTHYGGQSRTMSFVEATTNVAVGYLTALLTQLIVFPLFGVSLPLGDNLAIGGIFTLASLGRSYILRRLFVAARSRGGG